MDDKKLGVVKYFNESKGFGFITCEQKDYFVHFSDIIGDGYRSLNKDDAVYFKIVPSPKGPKAGNVSRKF